MILIMRLGMRNSLWIWWVYVVIHGTLGFPVDSIHFPGSFDTRSTSEGINLRYVFGSIIIVAMVSTLLGCLCCRRERHAKGFQDTGGDKSKEFKDGSTAGSETIIERGLELEVSRSLPLNRVQFEPLTVERFVPETNKSTGEKIKSPSPLLYRDREGKDIDDEDLSSCREWFSPELHVSRERLKYLREIGRGWFGKVVEGTQDLDLCGAQQGKTRGMVVRILTEEASTSERAWFLGEALPYLKLHHRNILELIGACLETDPYLLLFESCPTGDLKNFLRSNRTSMDTLTKENVPLRMALDISVALDHMHRHGFSHMDLSARNCLVAPDLSAKLGDYGVGVEKYPDDYYVVGDRALPIRWSAPESLVCTDTTIETRAIMPSANLWSFAIFLWEIATWGERPYGNLTDEQVIEMILGAKFKEHLTLNDLNDVPENILIAIESCWKLMPNERSSLQEITKLLRGDKLADFDQRWEVLKPNMKESMRSVSLRELRESTDSDIWQMTDEKCFSSPQASFKLGPDQPSMQNAPLSGINMCTEAESGSETEEESWRGRVERGAYTEKVKQKSKSVADLMVLVHIESDSEAEWSLTPQIIEKPSKKRLLASGSVGDLRDSVIEDEFDVALQKLRDPANNPYKLSRKSPDEELGGSPMQNGSDTALDENLKCMSECTSTPKNVPTTLSGAFVDVELWKNALEFELERKIPGFDLESIDFEKYIGTTGKCESLSVPDLMAASTISAPDTPQSRGEDLSVDNEDFSNSDDIETERRRLPDGDDEEDRKHLSTPDDERSSDSGFRDKESCEEEENPMPCVLSVVRPLACNAFPTIPLSASTEEEQMKVLLELDTILDAEDCGSIVEGLIEGSLSPNKINIKITDDSLDVEDLNTQLEEVNHEIPDQVLAILNQEPEIEKPEKSIDDVEIADAKKIEHEVNEISFTREDNEKVPEVIQDTEESTIDTIIELNKTQENDNDDEDSSTISLRSDNSYVSYNLDEEFVTAIRNELREKLPRAQMSVVESLELHDEDEPSLYPRDVESGKSWDDDDEETPEQASGIVDIAIKYNIYGTPLSPILEERESTATSESLGDASIASKLSALSDDVLVVDTRTNHFILVEGTTNRHDDDGETSNGDITDEDSFGCGSNSVGSKFNDFKMRLMGGGAPLPSPEEESKWQAQFPIPIQLQDDLMSTSFSTEHDWDSQDEEDDEGRGVDGGDEDDDENSSSSGEFVWKSYDDESNQPDHQEDTDDTASHSKQIDTEGKIDEEEGEDDEDEEEEFTPSAWDANLAPHRSALRSPEKTHKAGDQKKNVWFKKQRYHCVYEYPKEVPVMECQGQATTTWEPTSYAEWEEMMDEPKIDVYPMDYDDSNQSNEEFFVSSGNRPFQFQVGDGKYVSQFFPGASGTKQSTHEDSDRVSQHEESHQDSNPVDNQCLQQQQQTQLGELRHTRDRLKLNLPIKQMGSDAAMNSNVINDHEMDNSERENGVSDNSQDLKTEKRGNSSESTLSKEEPSIISIIRSPIDLSLENLSREELKSPINGETDLEISELEDSSKDECIVKSLCRPLILLNEGNSSEVSSNEVKSDKKSNDFSSDVGTDKKKNNQVPATGAMTLPKQNETQLMDESIAKPSMNECVIESKKIVAVEETTQSVREST